MKTKRLPSRCSREKFSFSELNLYRYCHNDPVNKSDRTGLYIDTILDAGFIVYDLYQLATDPANRGEHSAALGLDILGAALPGATGLGAAYRATKAADRLQTAGQVGQTVLGRHPEYLTLAGQLGAKRFNIPEKVWNSMSAAEKWTANQKFLDRAIARGDDFLLATPLDKVKPGSSFARELDYLSKKGYVPSSDGRRLIHGGQ